MTAPITPNSNPFNEITDESLEQAAEQAFTQPEPTPSPAEAPEGHGQPPVETTPQPEPTTEPAPEPDGFEYEPGKVFTREQIKNYAQFDGLLASNPELSRLIYNYLRGEPAPGPNPQSSAPASQPAGGPQEGAGGQGQGYPTAPSPANLPPDVDLSDPTAAYLYSIVGQQQAALQNYHEELARQREIIGNRVQEENQQIIDTATESFRTQYALSNEDMIRIKQAAAASQVIPSIMNTGRDPYTQQAVSPDALTAITKAYEYASYAHPEIREKVLAQRQMADQADNTRKQKLQAVGGSSKPAPRTIQVPNDPQARRQAMVQEVAANWSQS